MLKKILKSREKWMHNSKKREISETKVETKEILKMCRNCYSFNYDGAWHFEEPKYIREKDSGEEIYVQFTKCPPCVEELLAQYDLEFA